MNAEPFSEHDDAISECLRVAHVHIGLALRPDPPTFRDIHPSYLNIIHISKGGGAFL